MDAKWWQYLTWPFGSGELKNDEKMGITPRRVIRFTSKKGHVDLDKLNMFSVYTQHLSLIVFEIKDESINIFKIWWKKVNNFKMGNQIYFKIVGYVDLDMLNMFVV